MIGSGDELRTPGNACAPDDRVRVLGRGTLEQHHAIVRGWELHAGVPGEVREIFETARNLYLYSWFVYRFQPVAWFWSWTAVETALRIRAGTSSRAPVMLVALLRKARAEGWIRAEQFSRFQELRSEANPPTADDYLDSVLRLARLRNSLGHGSAMALPWQDHVMAVNCELINQLFDTPDGSVPSTS